MMINIQASALQAALICAAKKDVRYYLNGVHVEFTSARHALCVGTDGAMLGAFAAEYTGEDPPKLGTSFVIPYETIKGLKLARNQTTVSLTLASDGSCGTLGDRMFKPVDGRYPDFRRVVPTPSDVDHENQTASTVNPSLLVRGVDALRTFRGKPEHAPFLIQRGTDAAVLHDGGDEAVVVVMPMRLTGETRFLGIASDTWTGVQS